MACGYRSCRRRMRMRSGHGCGPVMRRSRRLVRWNGGPWGCGVIRRRARPVWGVDAGPAGVSRRLRPPGATPQVPSMRRGVRPAKSRLRWRCPSPVRWRSAHAATPPAARTRPTGRCPLPRVKPGVHTEEAIPTVEASSVSSGEARRRQGTSSKSQPARFSVGKHFSGRRWAVAVVIATTRLPVGCL